MINKNEGEESNSDKNEKKVMNDFFNSIISYRVHSIKVIEYYLLFKEKIIQGNIRDKFDEEYIRKKYGLLKNGSNYILKMKNDMSFLINSKIYNNRDNNDIFNSFKGDPFLTCLYNVIPVSREYKQRIKYCQYYIMQETLNENIMKENRGNNQDSIIMKTMNNNNINLNDIKEYKNYKKKRLEPIINHSHYKEKQDININQTNQNNINKDYNTNESELSKRYNKSAINAGKNNNKDIYDDNKNNNEINKVNKKKEFENNKNSNYSKVDNLNDDIVNIHQESNKNHKYSSKINLNNIQINNNNEKEVYEDINNNININYEKEKQTKHKKNNKDEKNSENILQNSLTISKKIKKESSRSATPESKKLANVNPSNINKNETNNNINTSIVFDNSKLKNYNTSYYCGTLSDFITIYTSYYNRIPIEQKRIFNIKENPENYFNHNYYPKIIICSDTKLTLIKGICIYSLIFNTKENKSNKIIIEHLSSYNKEEMENILQNMFEFLKNNNIINNSNVDCNVTNEIYIDLYFYLENEKFMIDTSIRDFIKNELKFKWVKLENKSKEIRYQKMKHQFNNSNNNNLLNNEIDDNNILNQSIIGKKALNEMKKETKNNKENDNDDDSKDNTLEDICSNDNISENNLFCNFCIKNKSVIQYMKKSDVEKNLELNKNKLILNNIKYINPFNIIYLVKTIAEDTIYSEYILNNTYNFFTMNDHLDIN